MKVVGIDHVQIPIPPGGEALARKFYGEVLGLHEVPKPEAMRARGGMWFVEGIHLGIEEGMRPSTKGHPALLVADFAAFRARLVEAGYEWRDDFELPGVTRGHTKDPFGNRIELVDGTAPPSGGADGRAHPTVEAP